MKISAIDGLWRKHICQEQNVDTNLNKADHPPYLFARDLTIKLLINRLVIMRVFLNDFDDTTTIYRSYWCGVYGRDLRVLVFFTFLRSRYFCTVFQIDRTFWALCINPRRAADEKYDCMPRTNNS